MLFNFTLRPLELVQPWGKLGARSLSWFGLTDGEYWIQVGRDALFEYGETAAGHTQQSRYCDYQVARLYEDLIELAPHVLEPVPPPLFSYITYAHGACWDKRREKLLQAFDHGDDGDHYWEIIDAAERWIGRRTLDSAYLSPSTRIRMWSEDSVIHIEWDNRDKLIDGLPAWSAAFGSFQLRRDDFIQEVQSFHSRLMRDMGNRVKEVLAGALPEDVRIDLEGLEREHEHRSASIDRTLIEVKPLTDWNAVQRAIRMIEDASA